MRHLNLSKTSVEFNHCRNCIPETGRHPGCHATCEYYLKDRKEMDNQKSILFKESKYDTAIKSYKFQRIHELIVNGKIKPGKIKKTVSSRGDKLK